MSVSTQDAHMTKKEILAARGIIRPNPAENLRFQEALPRGFSLNLCGHCNYRCRYCPQGVSPQPEGYLDLKLAARLFDELQDRPVYVQISARGESLQHPEFFAVIDMIKEASADSFICLNTNGALIDEAMAGRLVASGIDQIQVSLQTVDGDLYRKMTGSPLHDRVMAGLDALARRAGKGAARLPMLTAQFLDTPENAPHRGAFEAFCADRGIHGHVQQMHHWGGTFEALDRADPDRYPCPYLFLYPTIGHDGRVAPCFIDFHGEYAYGSIATERLATIWHSSPARRMREIHLAGRWAEIPICRNCQGYRLIPSGFTRRDGRFVYEPATQEGVP